MPFDPNLPADHSPNSSAQMRGQLTGLNALISAMQSITGALVDSVNTLPAGSAATVSVSVSGTHLHFTFGIPQGYEGPQGQPFATAVVDGVNTLGPSDPATVDTSFDGTNVHFTFGIPRGQDGVPGEVTSNDLTQAINGTSNNSNAVNTLGLIISDPPSQSEVQTVADKLDELIQALRR